MSETPNIAAIVAAAKDKALRDRASGSELDEVKHEESSEVKIEPESAERLEDTQAQMEAKKLKQERLEEIQAQRSEDAKALAGVRQVLNAGRTISKIEGLSEDDKAESLKELNVEEAQQKREEINERRKETRPEALVLGKEIDQERREEIQKQMDVQFKEYEEFYEKSYDAYRAEQLLRVLWVKNGSDGSNEDINTAYQMQLEEAKKRPALADLLKKVEEPMSQAEISPLISQYKELDVENSKQSQIRLENYDKLKDEMISPSKA